MYKFCATTNMQPRPKLCDGIYIPSCFGTNTNYYHSLSTNQRAYQLVNKGRARVHASRSPTSNQKAFQHSFWNHILTKVVVPPQIRGLSNSRWYLMTEIHRLYHISHGRVYCNPWCCLLFCQDRVDRLHWEKPVYSTLCFIGGNILWVLFKPCLR